MGIVIRTAAIGASEEALLEDIRHLCANWRVIEARGKVEKAPATLYRELDLSVRIVRDYLKMMFPKLSWMIKQYMDVSASY